MPLFSKQDYTKMYARKWYLMGFMYLYMYCMLNISNTLYTLKSFTVILMRDLLTRRSCKLRDYFAISDLAYFN